MFDFFTNQKGGMSDKYNFKHFNPKQFDFLNNNFISKQKNNEIIKTIFCSIC